MKLKGLCNEIIHTYELLLPKSYMHCNKTHIHIIQQNILTLLKIIYYVAAVPKLCGASTFRGKQKVNILYVYTPTIIYLSPNIG